MQGKVIGLGHARRDTTTRGNQLRQRFALDAVQFFCRVPLAESPTHRSLLGAQHEDGALLVLSVVTDAAVLAYESGPAKVDLQEFGMIDHMLTQFCGGAATFLGGTAALLSSKEGQRVSDKGLQAAQPN